MAKKTPQHFAHFGKFAFFAGLIVAILVGVFSSTPTPGFAASIVLLIIGLIIGLINITEKEIVPFLVASIALIVLGTANVIPFEWINRIIAAIIVLVVPAALIGALRAIYVMGSKK
jgi:hypothetical protein